MSSVVDAAAPAESMPVEMPRAVPWGSPLGGLVARLRASEALRRCVPAPLAMAAVDATQRLAARRDPARLEAARADMAAVVGGTAREGDLDELTVRHLCAWARGWELMFRPWLLEAFPIEGAEHLAGLEPGRGVVFSMPHFGPAVSIAALPRLVGPIHAALGEYLYADEAPPGYDGYQNEQVRKLVVRGDWRMVRAKGSARTFSTVLQDGGRVFLNFDVPGKQPVRFLGKTVELMSGAARLAQSTDAVVVPTIALPRGRSWYVHLGEPLDPRRYERWEDLLQDLADVLSELVLRAPEYLESPLRDGGWAVATAEGWRRSA